MALSPLSFLPIFLMQRLPQPELKLTCSDVRNFGGWFDPRTVRRAYSISYFRCRSLSHLCLGGMSIGSDSRTYLNRSTETAIIRGVSLPVLSGLWDPMSHFSCWFRTCAHPPLCKFVCITQLNLTSVCPWLRHG